MCVYIIKYAFAIVMHFSNAFNNQFIIGPPAWPIMMTNIIIIYVHTHTKDTYKSLYCMICPCNCNKTVITSIWYCEVCTAVGASVLCQC